MKSFWKVLLIGGSPPPSQVSTARSADSPVLEPTRMRLGRAGVAVLGSPMRTSSRCSMYVFGVVSGSTLVDMIRAWLAIGVPAPSFHERASVGPA